MLFPTFEFFLFFTVILVLNWYLKRWPIIWRLFLLLASYFFYSLWDVRFLYIIFFVSLFNFLTGLAIYFGGKNTPASDAAGMKAAKRTRPVGDIPPLRGRIVHKNFIGKKPILIGTVIINILILGLFKYYDFFRVSAESLLEKFGLPATLPFLEIILPLGMSFYIFRVISYNIDVYRKKYPPTTSLLDFLIYVAFFPQLLSGPIARADEFLPQLKAGGTKVIENTYEYFTLIFLGLFKKLVISSYLVSNITDDVFAVPENHASYVILLAVFAYSLVIYFDFSGYSDLAIGFAGLMGFKSPINFNSPYLSLNIKDFWRRWHITLSNWIRDYVYIPLGGSRKGLIRKYFNLMVAMLVVGLWHGAAVHFIFWGGLQGLGLVASHFLEDVKKTGMRKISIWRENFSKIFWWLITFSFVSFSWIFFRSDNMQSAFQFIKNLFYNQGIIEKLQTYTILVILIGFLLFLFEKQVIMALTLIQQKMPLLIWFAFVILFVLSLFKLGPDIIPPFIYFSF
jgi:D-alanyl-lipoteichoic acid acyltransferase DltB (MBOAT superfamily)